uniref:Endonuclease/exonuclease/phosphatase domain-containing protein n=1 Tax=Chenopodium quinoa TaxID=63459 RepID=A0A803MWR8_CHEQI
MCPCKRNSVLQQIPDQVEVPSDAGSVCLSFLKPFKKRRCNAGSLVSGASADDAEDMAVKKLSSLAFDGSCGMDALGHSGGLAVFWFAPVVVVPISFSHHVIVCKVVAPGQVIKYIIFVYGAPHISLRQAVWDEISSILLSVPNVVLLEDFNQVEFFSDKVGGSLDIPGRHSFLEWKLNAYLMDIPFYGPHFTWTNGQLHNPMFERLDKGFATASWKRPYKIENWCLGLPEISSLICSSWKDFSPGSGMYLISRKLDTLKKDLLSWCVAHKRQWGIDWQDLRNSVNSESFEFSNSGERSSFLHLRHHKISQAQASFMYCKKRCKVKWDALGESHSRLLFRSVQAR